MPDSSIIIRKYHEQNNVVALLAENIGVNPVIVNQEDIMNKKLTVLGVAIRIITELF